VWSYDKYSSDAFLGQVSLPLLSISPNTNIKQWHDLQAREEKEKVKGKISLEIMLATDTVRNKTVGTVPPAS